MVTPTFWFDLWPAALMLVLLVVWGIGQWAIERSVSAQLRRLNDEEDSGETPKLYVIKGGRQGDWHKFISLDEEAS